MDSEIKKKWVTRLRRTKKFQGKGFLGTENNFRCCLGILCDLAVEAKVIPKPKVNAHGHLVYDGADRFLPQSVADWAKLPNNNPRIDLFDHKRNLAGLNDSQMDFKRIADLIEGNDPK